MSRLFYSLEEAAAKLKKSPAELLQMAQAGQLQEFRDKDQIKFKAADIDQLAQTDDDGLDLELGDLGGGSSGGFDLPLSGSGAGGPDPNSNPPGAHRHTRPYTSAPCVPPPSSP